MRLYVAALTAMRMNNGHMSAESCPTAFNALDDPSATQIAEKSCEEVFKPKDGYFAHKVSIVEVPERLYKPTPIGDV